MKRTVLINLEALYQISPELDLIDGAILDYFVGFSHNAQKLQDQGHIWFWVSSYKVIEDIPALGIKTDRGIRKRIDKLVDFGLLVRYEENQNQRKSFYRMGSAYDLYLSFSSALGTGVPTNVEPQFQVTRNWSSDNNSIIDNSINDNIYKSDQKNLNLGKDPKKKTVFKNSIWSDNFSFFEKKLREKKDFEQVNAKWYFESVLNWSEQKGVKVLRDANGWLATARQFIMSDYQSKKVVFLNDNADIQKETEKNNYMEYLRLGENGID